MTRAESVHIRSFRSIRRPNSWTEGEGLDKLRAIGGIREQHRVRRMSFPSVIRSRIQFELLAFIGYQML